MRLPLAASEHFCVRYWRTDAATVRTRLPGPLSAWSFGSLLQKAGRKTPRGEIGQEKSTKRERQQQEVLTDRRSHLVPVEGPVPVLQLVLDEEEGEQPPAGGADRPLRACPLEVGARDGKREAWDELPDREPARLLLAGLDGLQLGPVLGTEAERNTSERAVGFGFAPKPQDEISPDLRYLAPQSRDLRALSDRSCGRSEAGGEGGAGALLALLGGGRRRRR